VYGARCMCEWRVCVVYVCEWHIMSGVLCCMECVVYEQVVVASPI